MNYLTYRQAAKRVHRSVRTINRWRRAGMPMTFDAHGYRVVEERVLLAWWRERMTAWPPQQYRIRAMQRAQQLAAETEHPDTPKVPA